MPKLGLEMGKAPSKNAWELYAAGIITGLVGAGIVSAFHIPLEVLQQFQGLIAGVLALVGAVLTVFYINRQVRESQKQFHEMRQRKSTAARSVMPGAVNTVVNYLERCVKIARSLEKSPAADESLAPVIRGETLQILRDCVEYADAHSADVISDLLSQLQVHGSRLERTISQTAHAQQPASPFINDEFLAFTAHTYALALRIFPYARREAETVPAHPLREEEIRSAVYLMRLNDLAREKTVREMTLKRFGLERGAS